MKIKDRTEFKNKPPVMSFKQDEMISVAVKDMSEKNYGAGVIVDKDNRPVGIITERDFMRRVLANDIDPNKTPISKVMTTNLRLASANDNVVDWLRIMSNERFRHLPVVDEDGKLVNLMSQGDFVSYTWPQLLTKAAEETVETFLGLSQLQLLVGGIMVYSIAMIIAFSLVT